MKIICKEYRFQFQTGAIKRPGSHALIGEQFYVFQFQTGAIKSPTGCRRCGCHRGFNSKLVRLKANINLAWQSFLPRFQFQTGAIKRLQLVSPVLQQQLFQFQTGAIKSSHRQFGSMRMPGFNSKLVRLKVLTE